MVELPLQNIKATAVLETCTKTHVKPFAGKCDECENKLRYRIESQKDAVYICLLKYDMRKYL